jgi:nucleoside-diphosphate-sugar epimerase
MKVFVAGGSGVFGMRLVGELAARGHEVVATTTKPERSVAVQAAGAQPIVVDLLDGEAVMTAVEAAAPEVVVHEATALAGRLSLRRFDGSFALTNRLRTEGTDNLLAAAVAAGAGRFVAQSYTGWPNAREGGPVKTEADRLDPDPPKAARETLAAIRTLEAAVGERDDLVGVVLRYGAVYGPGTGLGQGGEVVEAVHGRKMPLVGDAGGVWSFLHLDDMATATVGAVEGRGRGVYNVVDDDPATVSEWLPYLARALGAKPPRRVPAWLARLIIGEQGLAMMTESRGSSNAKAKRELDWQPAWPSWRDGFVRGLGVGSEQRLAQAA